MYNFSSKLKKNAQKKRLENKKHIIKNDYHNMFINNKSPFLILQIIKPFQMIIKSIKKNTYQGTFIDIKYILYLIGSE